MFKISRVNCVVKLLISQDKMLKRLVEKQQKDKEGKKKEKEKHDFHPQNIGFNLMLFYTSDAM